MADVANLRATLLATAEEVDAPPTLEELARSRPCFFWEHPASGEVMAAAGSAAQIVEAGPGRLARAARSASNLMAAVEHDLPEGLRPRLVGGFAFSDAHSPTSWWREFPPVRLFLPRHCWLRSSGRWWHVEVSAPALQGGTDGAGEGQRLPARARLAATPSSVDGNDDSDARAWVERVERALERVDQGELAKVVLARSRHLHGRRSFAPPRVVSALREARPDCYTYWLGAQHSDFVGSSPELLVRLREGRATTVALAGSAARDPDPERDERAGRALLACPKNNAEHRFVVDDLAAKLGSLATHLEAPASPCLRRLPEAFHLATELRASVKQSTSLLQAASLLHPSPAVCGVPQAAALRLIERTEPARGWYAGGVGWMDAAGEGTLAVALRSAVLAGSDALVWAGAGIVSGSQARAELAETELKMAAMAEVLERDGS